MKHRSHQTVQATQSSESPSRSLGLRDLIVFGLLFTVPIAPMSMYGYVAGQSSGRVALVFLLGWGSMLFIAYSYWRFSRVYDRGGSVYTYVSNGLDHQVGWFAGWFILADYLFIPAVLYANSAQLISTWLPNVPAYVWIACFGLITFVISRRSIHRQMKIGWIFLLMELGALALFVVVAIYFLSHHAHASALPDKSRVHPLTLPLTIKLLAIGAMAFLGFDGISTLSEEVAEPRKSVGKGILVTFVILGGLFLVQALFANQIYPNFISLDPATGFFDLSRIISGPWLYWIFVCVTILASGVVNAWAGQTASTRILFAFGRDEKLPLGRWFSHLHPTTRVPRNASSMVAVLSVALAIWVPAQTLNALVSFGALGAFVLLQAALFWQFVVKSREAAYGMRLLDAIVSVIGAGLVIMTLIATKPGRPILMFGTVWFLLGVAVWILQSPDETEASTRVPPKT